MNGAGINPPYAHWKISPSIFAAASSVTLTGVRGAKHSTDTSWATASPCSLVMP